MGFAGFLQIHFWNANVLIININFSNNNNTKHAQINLYLQQAIFSLDLIAINIVHYNCIYLFFILN